VRGLTIEVDHAPDHKGADLQVPWYARVKAVTLGSLTSETSARIDARIRAAMGVPKIDCYMDGLGYRQEIRYWAAEHGRGIQLRVVVRDSVTWPSAEDRPTYPSQRGSGSITFGAEPMTSQYVTLEPCD
jgi:hypothetical protein